MIGKWSDDELRVITEVAIADETGLVPNDRWLPTYEALRARGVLIRKLLSDGEPSYQASERFRAKAALLIHQMEAERQAGEN